MITNTTKIFDKVAKLEVGEVVYFEVSDEGIARAVNRRLTTSSRFKMANTHKRFSCRQVLAVQSPSQTQILTRIERLQDAS